MGRSAKRIVVPLLLLLFYAYLRILKFRINFLCFCPILPICGIITNWENQKIGGKLIVKSQTMKEALTSNINQTETKMPLFCYQCEKTEVAQFRVPTDWWKNSAMSEIDGGGAVLWVWDEDGWDAKQFEDEGIGDFHEDLDWSDVTPEETENEDGTTTLRYEMTFYLTFNLPSEFGADWDEHGGDLDWEIELTDDCRLRIYLHEEILDRYVIEADEHGDTMTQTDYWEDEIMGRQGTTFKRCVCIKQ